LLTQSLFNGSDIAPFSHADEWSQIYQRQPDWLAVLFFGLLLYFVVIKFLFHVDFLGSIKGLSKIQVLDDIGFDKNHQRTALLYAPFALIIYTLYCLFLLNPLLLQLELDYLFLGFAILLIVLFILKLSVSFAIAHIFHSLKAFKAYFTDHLFIMGVGSIFQLFFLLIYLYSQITFFLHLSLTILSIFIVLRIIRSSIIGLRLTNFSIYYLFLYLCSFEILPVIWIYKWISIQ
jgi:hypothetical protein